jgi:hypothetical protein
MLALELVTMPLTFLCRLRAGKHFVEEAASLLQLSEYFEYHQLVS